MSGHVHIVEVKYEWVRTYKVAGGDEAEAEQHAIELAKEDLVDEMESGPPSASEFETYVE